jgi:hydroxymethylpyrimidine pyrophosphatase-like HAD family hydrolase
LGLFRRQGHGYTKTYLKQLFMDDILGSSKYGYYMLRKVMLDRKLLREGITQESLALKNKQQTKKCQYFNNDKYYYYSQKTRKTAREESYTEI